MTASDRELAAVDQLVAAKDAYRAKPSQKTRQQRDDAVAAVEAIRAEERNGRTTQIGGDAYIEGTR